MTTGAKEFWDRVIISTPDKCWPWTAGLSRGYGVVRDMKGAVTRAHRQAYFYTYGPVPAGLSVLHHCDNPPCCNPVHLYAGTAKDNMRDAMERGRWRPRPTVRTEEARAHETEMRHRMRASTPTSRAVDGFTSDLETLLLAIRQREMAEDQLERLARILQTAERDVLARSTKSAAKGRRRVRAA